MVEPALKKPRVDILSSAPFAGDKSDHNDRFCEFHNEAEEKHVHTEKKESDRFVLKPFQPPIRKQGSFASRTSSLLSRDPAISAHAVARYLLVIIS